MYLKSSVSILSPSQVLKTDSYILDPINFIQNPYYLDETPWHLVIFPKILNIFTNKTWWCEIFLILSTVEYDINKVFRYVVHFTK